jgi:hypothetical protein
LPNVLVPLQRTAQGMLHWQARQICSNLVK